MRRDVPHIASVAPRRLYFVADGAPAHGIAGIWVQSLITYLTLHSNTSEPHQEIAFRLWPDSSEVQAQ